ncbi:MAG: hypothetical protein MHPSP_003388 [Paramarteilia canceri]
MAQTIKRIAVVLTGCGHRDSTEIHEASALISSAYECSKELTFFAPDFNYKVFNHYTGQETEEMRNSITESTRISRVACNKLKDLNSANFDGLMIPGGIGSFEILYEDLETKNQMTAVLQGFISNKKPVVCVCIAPKMVAKCIEESSLMTKKYKLTVGNDLSHFSDLSKIIGVKTGPDVFF